MRVAQTSISSRSALKVAVPSTMTNAKGGRSSSTQIATRGSRARALPLTVPAPVVNTMWSPSSTNQIGAMCGAPFARVVASLPVRVPSVRKARVSSADMSRAIGEGYAARRTRTPLTRSDAVALPSVEDVRIEVKQWLEENWNPELTVAEWWDILA